MTIQTCCVYCKATGVPFNTEHVIPQAFGSYGAGTMALNEVVCKECNSKKKYYTPVDLLLMEAEPK